MLLLLPKDSGEALAPQRTLTAFPVSHLRCHMTKDVRHIISRLVHGLKFSTVLRGVFPKLLGVLLMIEIYSAAVGG